MASRYRMEQRRITHRGRSFHFVSYEGRPANAARNEEPIEPAWFLVNSGYRWKVMTQDPDLEPAELDRRLMEWLDNHVFATLG